MTPCEQVTSNGEQRDVTQLTCYEPTNRNVIVDHDGLARREKFGQATVLVRFLTRQLAVPLAFLPARPSFTWEAPQPENYIDRLAFAPPGSRAVKGFPERKAAERLLKRYLRELA